MLNLVPYLLFRCTSSNLRGPVLKIARAHATSRLNYRLCLIRLCSLYFVHLCHTLLADPSPTSVHPSFFPTPRLTWFNKKAVSLSIRAHYVIFPFKSLLLKNKTRQVPLICGRHLLLLLLFYGVSLDLQFFVCFSGFFYYSSYAMYHILRIIFLATALRIDGLYTTISIIN